MCGFIQSESNSFRISNPKKRRVVESRSIVFIGTPHLPPPSRRLSPLQGLEGRLFDLSDNSLVDNYPSRKDMIRDAEGLRRCFGLRRQRHYITSSSTSLARTFFALGSHTARIIVSPVPAPVSGQHRRTGGTASNCDGYQLLCHAARCYARCYTQPSSFTCSYRLSAKSKEPRGFSRGSVRGTRSNNCTN